MERDICENIDTSKFLPENTKWDKILSDNSPDKAYETFHFFFFFLTSMILHFQKVKLELKLNI